jgi:hypothetical protein
MTKLTWDDVVRWRLHRHHLGGAKAKDPVAAARRLSGVHAQVAASAVTATDLRVKAAVTARKLDKLLYDDRTLVRTWAARGTLHLLPAADLPTWVAAMSTRTRENTASWLRYNGVTAAQMKDILGALPDVLGAEPLTRTELADAIIGATGHTGLHERLTHGFGTLLKPAAFRGLLCSGPPRGRNVTFVAPRAWLPKASWEVDTDEAVDTLAQAYLDAYGPATPEEFASWFDLRPALAKKSFARLDTVDVEVDGVAMKAPADGVDPPAGRATIVLLLPAFDPYVVGSTRQLERIGAAGHKSDVSRPQGWISPTLVVDGWIRGVWTCPDGAERPVVTPFEPLPPKIRKNLDADVTDR